MAAILLRRGLRASKGATVSARALSVVPFDEAKQIAAAKEIDDRGRACGLKFYQCSWVDLFGVQRSKLVPAARIGEIAAGGAGFAGFAAHLDMDPTTGDLLAMPDAATLAPLPWRPEVGWLACDLVHECAELAPASCGCGDFREIEKTSSPTRPVGSRTARGTCSGASWRSSRTAAWP